MRLSLALLALAALTSACGGDAPPTPDAAADGAKPASERGADASIGGSYAVSGTNADGSPYTGALNVTQRGDVYQFSWATGNDYEGVGLRSGDVVAVGFGGEACGVALYRVGGDGTLDGEWALYGTEAAGTERATRAESATSAASGSAEGTYRIEGANPDGSAYTGALTVDATGPAYALRWEVDTQSVGVGLLEGGVLGSSYGGEDCGVALYRVEGDALVGTWSAVGVGATGTERAERQ